MLRQSQIPVFAEALAYADEFLLTAAAQRNRNYVGDNVRFDGVSFAMEEVLLDPQTSGGLLAAVAPEAADELVRELWRGLPAAVIGELTEKQTPEIIVQ